MLIPSGYCNAKYRFTFAGDPDEMVITCGHDDAGLTPTALADALFDAFRDIFTGANWMSSTSVMGTDVQIGTSVGGGAPYSSGSSTLPIYGGSGGATGAWSNTALLVRKVTALPGRRGRGRMYVPGILSTSSVDENGMVLSATRTAIQSLWDLWHVRLTADGLAPVLLHADGDPTPSPISGFIVDSQVGTQRRRMRS